MKVDLLHTFSWEETNELLRERLTGFSAPADLRVYAGLGHGLFELAFGVALLYSHKKCAAVISGETWAFEGVLPSLYKEGFQVQDQRRRHVTHPREWVDSLKKETSFVLWNEDHPVTGSFTYNDEIDAILNEKRIFSIRVSHSAFLTRAQEVRPYSVRLCSITPTLSLAVCGSKFRGPPLAANRMFWQGSTILQEIEKAIQVPGEDRTLVEQFESAVGGPTSFRPLLSAGDRLYDRAVVYHPGINAEAVYAELGDLTQKASPMFESGLEILNQCRWRPAPHLRTWWDPMPSEEVIRGLMLFSLPILKHKDLMKRLSAVEKNASLTIG